MLLMLLMLLLVMVLRTSSCRSCGDSLKDSCRVARTQRSRNSDRDGGQLTTMLRNVFFFNFLRHSYKISMCYKQMWLTQRVSKFTPEKFYMFHCTFFLIFLSFGVKGGRIRTHKLKDHELIVLPLR